MNYSTADAESRVNVLNVTHRKIFDKSSTIISPFPCSFSLFLFLFPTRWKMFGGQCSRVTTRHKSEVVIGKERRKRMQRMFARSLFLRYCCLLELLYVEFSRGNISREKFLLFIRFISLANALKILGMLQNRRITYWFYIWNYFPSRIFVNVWEKK